MRAPASAIWQRLHSLLRLPRAVVRDKVRHRAWAIAEHHGLAPVCAAPAMRSIWPRPNPGACDPDRIAVQDPPFVFGQPITSDGGRLDWQRDPLSGLTWPSIHHAQIDALDLARPSDARVVWELNRCQHLIPLAQSFALSGDDDSARLCLDQIDQWLRLNPPGIGINWTSSMEVAIRGVVWTWLLAALEGAPRLTPDRRAAIEQSLWAHGQHIWRHLEHEEHSGNHYLANALGLIALGMSFSTHRLGASWLQRGWSILNEEIPRQFYADGVSYEGSLAYHGLALEVGLLGHLLLQRAGRPLSEDAITRLHRALEFTLAITRSDGSYPAIGDVDDGHVLPLAARAPRSHAHLLALGAALFDQPTLARAGHAGADEVAWLLGPEAHARLLRLTEGAQSAPGSASFLQGGFCVMRAATHHLVVDCGDVGSLGRGGHGHADMLSIECYALGQPLVVDPGTYCYTADPSARDRYRSTRQHNTLLVDGHETLEPNGLWGFRQPAHPRLLHWSTDGALDRFCGEYALPGRPIVHRRAILFDRARGAWLIEDLVQGSDEHSVELRFHTPHTGIAVDGDRATIDFNNGVGMVLQHVGDAGLTLQLEPSAVSPLYLQEAPATAVILGGRVPLPTRCLTALVPYEGQCPDRAAVLAWARARATDVPRLP